MDNIFSSYPGKRPPGTTVYHPGHHAYAIVDGAATPGLLPRLSNHSADYRCLFRGELDSALAEAAPYLIQLKQYTAITEWLITTRGNHQNIFALIPDNQDFNAVHKHFRGFLRISGPDNQALYFRYYDPRVMHQFLADCRPEQTQTLFGPVKAYLVEDPAADVQRYWVGHQGIEHQPYSPGTHSPGTHINRRPAPE